MFLSQEVPQAMLTKTLSDLPRYLQDAAKPDAGHVRYALINALNHIVDLEERVKKLESAR